MGNYLSEQSQIYTCDTRLVDTSIEEIWMPKELSIEKPKPAFLIPESPESIRKVLSLQEWTTRLPEKLSFSPKFTELYNKSLYPDVFDNISININKFLVNKIKEYEIKFDIKNDDEIPDWEKLIVTIIIPKMSYKKYLTLWEETSKEVDQIFLKSQNKDIIEIKKKLFIKLEMK